jgi:hypothetical protein
VTDAELAVVSAARDLVDYVDTEGRANIDVAIRAVADAVDDWRAATATPADIALLQVQRGVRGFIADMRAQGIHVGVGTGQAVVCAVDGLEWPCPDARRLV